MIIANLTPDPLTWTHQGISGTIKPGQILEFEDKRGRHILNKLDARGLIQLKYGDDTEQRKAEALATWKRFWTRQITIFNQDNERRKNTQREYVDPQREVEEHAKALGLEMVGPWSVKQTDNSMVEILRDENRKLQTTVATLTEQMSSILAAMQERGEVPDALKSVAEKVALSKRGVESQSEAKNETPPNPMDEATLINEFSKLSKDRFLKWTYDNLARIDAPEYPATVRALIKDKWGRLIQEDPCPIED